MTTSGREIEQDKFFDVLTQTPRDYLPPRIEINVTKHLYFLGEFYGTNTRSDFSQDNV